MNITLEEAAKFLAERDRILILTHLSPDGDTLGSAGALCMGLTALGKQAKMACGDVLPKKYDDMLSSVPNPTFEPETVVAVDVADPKLLDALDVYADRVDLCIDHHRSNTGYAARTFANAAAANCENIYQILKLLGAELTEAIGKCLYTGLITDTGCFRYSCVTPETHRIAAELMTVVPNTAEINLQMFEIKTRTRLAVERLAVEQMEFAFDDRLAIITVTQEMLTQTGADEHDLEGIATIPRNVEGVQVGFMIREKADGTYKISCRTCETVDASKICAVLGGGGHARASGCAYTGTLADLKAILKHAAEPHLL